MYLVQRFREVWPKLGMGAWPRDCRPPAPWCVKQGRYSLLEQEPDPRAAARCHEQYWNNSTGWLCGALGVRAALRLAPC